MTKYTTGHFDVGSNCSFHYRTYNKRSRSQAEFIGNKRNRRRRGQPSQAVPVPRPSGRDVDAKIFSSTHGKYAARHINKNAMTRDNLPKSEPGMFYLLQDLNVIPDSGKG